METITDFLKEIKSRISNPFFGSFAISWLVINWRVPIGLIGYKQVDLKIDGYKSYINLISSNYSTKNYIFYPFLLALIYTFGFPLFRICIVAFLNWIRTVGNNWNMRILKKSHVPMEKYLQERKRYDSAQKSLEEIIRDESKITEDNRNLLNEKLDLQKELNNEKNAVTTLKNQKNDNEQLIRDMQSKLAILQYERAHQKDISILAGLWKMDISHKKQDLTTSYSIDIDKTGNIIIGERKDNWGHIKVLFIDFVNKHLSIVAEMKNVPMLLNTPFEPNDYILTLLELSISTIEKKDEILINYMEGEDNFGTTYRFRSMLY